MRRRAGKSLGDGSMARAQGQLATIPTKIGSLLSRRWSRLQPVVLDRLAEADIPSPFRAANLLAGLPSRSDGLEGPWRLALRQSNLGVSWQTDLSGGKPPDGIELLAGFPPLGSDVPHLEIPSSDSS